MQRQLQMRGRTSHISCSRIDEYFLYISQRISRAWRDDNSPKSGQLQHGPVIFFSVLSNKGFCQYLHCVICSTIRTRCILVHRFDSVAKGLWLSFYNWRMRFLHAGLHFAMTVTVSLIGRRKEKENRWIIAKRLFKLLKTRHSMFTANCECHQLVSN